MNTWVRWTFALIACSLLFVGCETSSKNAIARMKIELLPGGDMEVAGRICKLAELPASLRRAGAGTGTAIIIATPKRTTDAERSKIVSVLLSAKYRKFVFAGARQISVSTGTTTTTTTTIKPTSPITTSTSSKTTSSKTSKKK
jgi:hypothetical protein